MSQDDITLWKIVIIPALITALPGVVKFYQWWYGKTTEVSTLKMSAAERREQTLLAEQETLNKERRDNLAWVESQRDRAETEVSKERIKRTELEKDLERGWALARFYYRLGFSIEEQLNGLRLDYDAMCVKHGEPLQKWKQIDYPVTFEAPIPKVRNE